MGADLDAVQAAVVGIRQWWAQLFTVHLMLWLGVQSQPLLVQSFIMVKDLPVERILAFAGS